MSNKTTKYYIPSQELFPAWEQNIPSLGTKHSQLGNKTGLRLALDEITARRSRHYGSSLTTLRLVVTLLLMLVVGVSGVKAAFTEGLYYIKSNSDATFYLCPSIGCYYGNNVDQPHLTTFITSGDQNSIWKIVPVENETDTYYLIHYKTGKYLKSNENFTTIENNQTKSNRKAVHLEVKPETLTDEFKFLIKNSTSLYQIYPKSYYTDASGMSFNPTNGHKECYAPENGEARGMIGLFSKTDAASKWQIPAVAGASIPCATPIIKYDGGNIIISYPYSNETGITIYYTTDGTDPATSGTRSSYSDPISASNVIKVRAIATKTDLVNSDEAVLWGNARPFLIQSKECADYYLAPSGNGSNVCTTSIPGTGMQWTLQDAGTSTGGVQYYYVENSNKKINYNSSNNAITLNTASADANKFCVVENGYNTGNFFLIPVSQTSRLIYKVDGNVAASNCNAGLNKKWDTNLDQWIFRLCNEGADQKNLFSAPPFNVSTDEVMHYYHIANVGAGGYYMVPPTDADGYATTSNISSDYTNSPWIFKVAASDNWQTYYYIINAATGKYMYFNKANKSTSALTEVISMKDVSEKNADNEERFQFIMVRCTTTDACYIVPKGYSYADTDHINFNNNCYFGLWFDDNNPASLKTTWSRGKTANHVKWTFESATFDGAWADPVVSCDLEGNITITGENGAEFYYTKNSGTTLPATPTATESETNFKYSSSNKPTATAGFTTIKVRAIADGKQNSNVVKKTIIYNPTIALTAESYTYNGLVQNPVSSVSVGETSIASSEYEVKYQKEGDDTELTEVKDAGTYTILLKDADGGDYIVYGKNKTFTITPAALTITADAQTKGYGDADPELTYTQDGLLGTDVISGLLSRAEGESVGTYAINQGTLTAGDNYSTTYTGANLTISAKSLGDGNLPADGITIELNSEGELSAVKHGSRTLEIDTDYTSTTETEGVDKLVTVTGIGNYTGSAKALYIKPILTKPAGSDKAAAVYKASRDLANPSGIKPYIVRKVNPTIGTITISELEYIPEDVPVLLLSDAEAAGFVASPKDESTPEITDGTKNSNLLKVAPTGGVEVKAAQIYTFYLGEFVLTKAGTLSAGKFYLYNPNYTASATSASPAQSRSILQFVIDDDATGVDEINLPPGGSQPPVWRGASGYTLDGRRLSGKPTKSGIYILNGQKIYIKRK